MRVAESLEVQRWCFHVSRPVALPQLQRLVLEDCHLDADWWGPGPAPLCLMPSSLGLIGLFGLQPAAMRTLHVQCCRTVGSNSFDAGGQLVAGLAACSRLTNLSFAGSDFVNDAVAAETRSLAALAHLDLSTRHACRLSRRLPSTPGERSWCRLSPAGATALVAGPRTGLRSGLQSLTLRGQANLDDGAATALSQLTALTRLDMALPGTGWDVQLGDAGAQALGRGLTNLRVLRLGECRLAQRGCAALGRLTRLTGAPELSKHLLVERANTTAGTTRHDSGHSSLCPSAGLSGSTLATSISRYWQGQQGNMESNRRRRACCSGFYLRTRCSAQSCS